jgi:hypothetical protein
MNNILPAARPGLCKCSVWVVVGLGQFNDLWGRRVLLVNKWRLEIADVDINIKCPCWSR